MLSQYVDNWGKLWIAPAVSVHLAAPIELMWNESEDGRHCIEAIGTP